MSVKMFSGCWRQEQLGCLFDLHLHSIMKDLVHAMIETAKNKLEDITLF